MLLAAVTEFSDWHEGEYKSFLALMSEVSLCAFRSSASTEGQTQRWLGAYLTNLGITAAARVSFLILLILIIQVQNAVCTLKLSRILFIKTSGKKTTEKVELPTATNKNLIGYYNSPACVTVFINLSI